MSAVDHTQFRQNIPAYTLGALEAADVSTLESHLKTCMDCQHELAQYQSVTAGLLQAIPPRMPSPELRRQLADRLPARQPQRRTLFADFISLFSIRRLATLAVVVILLASNLYSALQLRTLQKQQAALAEQLHNEQAAIAMLAYPNTQTLTVNADMKNIAGSVVVDKDQNTAVFFLWHLPQLETTQTYQAWLIDANGKRVSGGLFTASLSEGYTAITILAPSPIKNFIRIGVTIEPQGGSDKPTGPRVLTVNL